MALTSKGPAVVSLPWDETLDLWYDQSTRSWVLQHKDAEGNQIGPRYGGEAAYVHSREEAVRELLDVTLEGFTKNCPLAQEGQGICTLSARELQEILGGKVYGYSHDDNPTAEAGRDEGGHDFLLVDGFIVDWWLKEYWSGSGVYHLRDDAAEVLRLYGDFKQWKKV